MLSYLYTSPLTDSQGQPINHDFPPSIPTEGHPATALDLFRVQELASSEPHDIASCFIDSAVQAGLGTFIQGELTHYDQLANAELALQAVLFHERVDVLVPSVLTVNETNTFANYIRPPAHSIDAVDKLLNEFGTQDFLLAFDRMSHSDGKITRRFAIDPKFLGGTVPIVCQSLEQYSRRRDIFVAACDMHQVPGYFSAKGMDPYIDYRGFFDPFFETVNESWAKETSSWTKLRIGVQLPPLVAVVLNRSKTRDTIPETVSELRQNLTDSRSELQEWSHRLLTIQSEAEAQSLQKRASEIFNSIVPAALQTNVERRQHFLAEILLLPKAVKAPLDYVMQFFNPAYKPKNPRRLVNRMTSARTMVDLLSVEAIPSLCELFFSKAEIKALRDTLPKK